MRHLISPLDFTVEETYEVLDFADRRKNSRIRRILRQVITI